MNLFFKEIIYEIETKHKSIELQSKESTLVSVRNMIMFISEKLESIKKHVLSNNFNSLNEEILFFKEIKPTIHGFLVFYKHIHNVESTCPIGNSKKITIHYNTYLKRLSKSNKKYYGQDSFYEYVKSGRTDKDELYFSRHQSNDIIYKGNETLTFIDLHFTTFYDSILSLIIAEEKLNSYLENKINPFYKNHSLKEKLNWSNSKSSMIELIYALHVSKSIPQSNIRKIASVFEQVFDIKLGDIHHTYHRMKYRTESRTLFLDQLKQALESHLGQNDQ